MSEKTHTHRVGGDDVIARLRDAGWQGDPDDVKALAAECRRLRDALEDTDLIDGRTILRVEVNMDKIINSGEVPTCGGLVITAPDRLESDPQFGEIISGAVMQGVMTIVDSWHRHNMLERVDEEGSDDE